MCFEQTLTKGVSEYKVSLMMVFSKPVPGERLSEFSSVWEYFNAPPDLQKVIREGHKIQFESKPKLTMPLKQFQTKLSPVQTKVVKAEVDELVRKKAMRVVPWAEACKSLGHYSQIFAVPKPNGKYRVIINMKPLNKHIVKETFSMESLKEVRAILKPNAWASIVDLSDAYYLVSIAKEDRKYCRFIFAGKIYEYNALPMGLSESPRVFTRVSRFAAGRIRRRGVHIIMYMDDLLVTAPTRDECILSVQTVVEILEELGFLLNDKKCHLEPARQFIYLGCLWDTEQWSVALRPEREETIRVTAKKLLSAGVVTYRKVAQFLGRIMSASGVVPLARARCRVLQWDFLQGKCKSNKDFNKSFQISSPARKELEFWTELETGLGSPITCPDSTTTVTTDASDTGLGIYFNGTLISEEFEERDRSLHINVKELWALWRFLVLYPDVKDTAVTWRVDNNSALAAIKNQGSTKSWALCQMSVNILEKAQARNLQIEPVRVSSEENVIADAGSRGRKVQDLSLNDRQAQRLFSVFGTPDVDLMATTLSRKCPVFYSWRAADREAWGFDSLARDVNWSNWSLPYCFPPFSLVLQVLQKAKEQKVKRMIVVVPWWPTKAYFPLLLNMLVEARRFRLSNSLLTDTVTDHPPPDVTRSRLVGCLISGTSEEDVPTSHKQRGILSRHPGGHLLSRDINSSGTTGLIGAPEIVYQNLRHL